MAIGRLSMKVGKAGKAGPHAAYIAREGQYANRLERGERLEATESGNMSAWAEGQPQAFWQAADAFERSNGTTYREMEIALPRELDAAQRIELAREWVRQEIGDRHAYQWAIHVPTAADGGEQPHLHLMFSERQRDGIERDPDQYFKRYNGKAPEKGGARKGYGPSAGQTLTRSERAADLKELRGRWEAMTNQHLERAGIEARIDMRSHADRGLDYAPEAKQLPSQWRDQEQRAQVLEYRAARGEQQRASGELRETVPDIQGELVKLDAERRKRARGFDIPKAPSAADRSALEAIWTAERDKLFRPIQAKALRIQARAERMRDTQARKLRAHEQSKPPAELGALRALIPGAKAAHAAKLQGWEAVRKGLQRRWHALMDKAKGWAEFAREGFDLYLSPSQQLAEARLKKAQPDLHAALEKSRTADQELHRQKIQEQNLEREKQRARSKGLGKGRGR